ncbi:hypothetical protein K9N68_19475 [Kovacikia minuta CCNUW1]|uniref:hypothetical protein n=1 Tax=Kovacikia minuta TaxID=2931930 RepID=UPI001CC9AE3A|nr:hypothetical protein [Kovacikia minuta]UBF23927.1 hypothetical protein K9N68_19475 [Kovacikia minuta CCNUW1]
MPYRFLLSLALLAIAGCNNLSAQQQPPDPKMNQVIQTFQQVEQTVKTSQGDQKKYLALVVEVSTAVTQIPNDTPPRVTELLNASVVAYKLAWRYKQCDQKSLGKDQAICRDQHLEKVISKFPYIKRNITQRLVQRTNPPKYISSVISTTNMLQLLLMQAELNRVDAHLILTGGSFDGVYPS